jgi:hypothetical protein
MAEMRGGLCVVSEAQAPGRSIQPTGWRRPRSRSSSLPLGWRADTRDRACWPVPWNSAGGQADGVGRAFRLEAFEGEADGH